MLSRYIAFRSIRFRIRRFLLSMFGIVLGVAALLAINVTNKTAMNSIVDLFQDTSGNTKLSIINADSDEQGFNEGVSFIIQNNSYISLISPIIKEFSDINRDQGGGTLDLGLFGMSGGGFLIQGILPDVDAAFREFKLSQGEFIANSGGKDEIVITESFAEEEDIELGEWMDIITPLGIHSVKVIGLVTKEGPGQINNGKLGIMHLESVQEIFDRKNEVDQIDLLTVNPDISTDQLNELKEALQLRLGEDLSVIFPASQGERMTRMLESYQIGLNLLSGMALFVGAFLIYNSFAMTVIERTREFGMLRTIGMTSQQVTGQVLLEAAMLGILGSGIGLLLGFALSRGLTQVMEIILNQSLREVQFPTQVLVTSFFTGVGVTLVAALIPAWQAGRISPLEALRARSKSDEGWVVRKGWIVGSILLAASIVMMIINPFPYDPQFTTGSATIIGIYTGLALIIPLIVGFWEPLSRPIIKFVYGSSGDLGSRNIQRARMRTTLTVAALLVGVSMVIMTKVITQSFASDLRSWMQGYIGGDIYISSSIPLKSNLAPRIESLSEVDAVVPIRYLNIEWQLPSGEFEDINYMGFDPFEYEEVTNIVFSDADTDVNEVLAAMRDNNAVLVTNVLSELHGIQIGDMVNLRTRSGIHAFPVAGIVVDFNNRGKVIQGSWDTMRRFFRINDATMFFVKTTNPDQINLASDAIEELYGKRYQLTIISNEDIRGQAFRLMDQTFSMFDVTSLIAIVVGSLGIINTLTISVIERTREIGMLRAIGLTNGQVVLMVLAEASLIGVIGGIFGALSGLLLSWITLISMRSMAGYTLEYVIPNLWVVISIVAAYVISQLAALIPSRRAVRIAILDALHYE